MISHIYFETYDQIEKIFKVTFCCLLDLYLTQVAKNDTKLSIKGKDVVRFLYNLHCNYNTSSHIEFINVSLT